MEKQTINAPGAGELARPTTRGGFFKALAVAGAGAAAGSAVFAREASAQSGGGSDIDILNFFYVNESFEADVFYPAALDAGILSGSALTVVAQIREIEVAHRDAVAAAIESLGGTPPPLPQFVVPGSVLTDQRTFLEAALEQEIKDVGANLGAAPMIRDPDILAAAASLEVVEGENVVAVSNLLGITPPANTAFPEALTREQALAILAPFLGMGEMLDTGGDSRGSTAAAF